LIHSAGKAGKPRLSAVSYLNTMPLVWGMLRGRQRDLFDLDFCLPSECADRLEAGSADIGIVPSVELSRLDLEVIPGAGIACCGPVRSILLISKVAPSRIRAMAADTSSRTSTVLAQIVLARRYSAEPAVVPMPPDLPAMLASADAAMIIGDAALRAGAGGAGLPFHVLDLGAEWFDMAGLPMVFAVWAGRPGIATPGLSAAFLDSCRYGRERIDEIARAEAGPRGLSFELARTYLAHHIVHELGEREMQGLRLFQQYASEFVAEPTGKASA
jgi:predicted solute-binding protein